MPNDAIVKIKQAEQDAVNIRKKAEQDATELISSVKRHGEELLAATEENTRSEITAMRNAVNEKAERLAAKSRFEAKVETAELRKNAKMRMRAAADEIIRGIDKQCQ